ncbi:GTPase [Schizosaccharomyces cryophilus OY26]|uniref:GTPase n=1 Tax=Schizosaccharomyces cryophilus (strain OY26 / ATCC MYA-4695 / CBS 11777 / NBRC 106824 / NRRL Y48691) TaxID=653667 RepID=S9VXN3_SCHCR|nr:GTPase [Schizosaccharomyces cryophilus OY26]EPY50755.1 GTPase [Schizosaccharomyces cryophilus OY26]
MQRFQGISQFVPTIYALSTPVGRAALSVVRVSGPSASKVIQKLTGKVPPPRLASLQTIKHPIRSQIVDKALILYFQKPASFTGEDIAEFHLHGGRAIIAEALDAIEQTKLPNLRYALPGEFSERAFYNGKTDLTQLEGLADAIDAETAEQLYAVSQQAHGDLYRICFQWKNKLVESRALLEATIDFSEEHELDQKEFDPILKEIQSLTIEMERHLSKARPTEILRQGIRVAVVGPPNAGKSSLVNYLAKRKVSIVNEQPGTTRDAIETLLDIHGFPVFLSDTAGFRQGPDVQEIESIGIEVAKEKAEQAQVILLILPSETWTGESCVLESEIFDLIENFKAQKQHVHVLLNKTDLVQEASEAAGPVRKFLHQALNIPSSHIHEVSIKSEKGLEQTLDALASSFRIISRVQTENNGDTGYGWNQRQREALKECIKHLKISLNHASDVVIIAEEMKLATDEIGRITGAVNVESLFDIIFSRFCVGK